MALPESALRAGYDRSAADYDARFAGIQRPKHDAVLARVTLPPGARVLDAGCGTGLLAVRLPAARVTGLDLSHGMLVRARGLAPVEGSVLALPFRDATFDAVFAITSLLVTPIAQALVELRRVVVPGGSVAITLLRDEAPRDFERELRACGLVLREPAFECGQDRGWIAGRT